MSAIGPGDWVEKYRYSPVPRSLSQREAPDIPLGLIYRVEEVIDGRTFEDGIGALVLVEVSGRDRDGDRFCYDIRSFRPIYRPKADLIESLKVPAERVDA